jgi:hypothetical protein
VTLTVDPAPAPPQLSVTPASLSFSATQGAGNPAAKSLAVANTGGGSLTFSASDDAPWLLVTPASGTAPQSLTVSADIAALPPGEHTAAVTVTSAGNQGSPATIPVTLNIAPAPPPALSVSPATLTFNATVGGAAPAAQTVNVTNSGGGSLTFNAADDAPWLSVTPGSGSAPQSLSVTASHAGLAPGAHSATVTVTAAGASGSPKTVAVTLNVAAAPPPTTGLVAAYGFEEPSGTTTVNDSSGTGNPGVISGATRIAAGRFGGGLSFDGVNDWVTAAHAPSLDMTTAMTLEAWVYPTNTTGWRTVILKERTAGLTYALYANEQTRRPIGMAYTTYELGAKGNATLPVNTWSHLAATFSGGTMRVYRNGAQVGTASIGTPIRTGNQPLRLGGNAIWNEWYVGRIDEVRIYNRALSAAEITTDMNNPVATGSTSALRSGSARAGRSAKARRNLRRAKRRSSLRRERARRDLPLRHHRLRQP